MNQLCKLTETHRLTLTEWLYYAEKYKYAPSCLSKQSNHTVPSSVSPPQHGNKSPATFCTRVRLQLPCRKPSHPCRKTFAHTARIQTHNFPAQQTEHLSWFVMWAPCRELWKEKLCLGGWRKQNKTKTMYSTSAHRLESYLGCVVVQGFVVFGWLVSCRNKGGETWLKNHHHGATGSVVE